MFYVEIGASCENIKNEIRSLLNNKKYKSKDIYKALEELSLEYFLQDNSPDKKPDFSKIPVVDENGYNIYADNKMLTVEDFIEKYN